MAIRSLANTANLSSQRFNVRNILSAAQRAVPSPGNVYRFVTSTGNTDLFIRGYASAPLSGVNTAFGPTQNQLNVAYANIAVFYDAILNVPRVRSVANGIQLWTVPFSGNIQLNVLGAAGGHSTSEQSGAGANMNTTLVVFENDVLAIGVGQGGTAAEAGDADGGGGGASGVYILGRDPANGATLGVAINPDWDSSNTYYPVIVAGGGGAAGSDSNGAGGQQLRGSSGDSDGGAGANTAFSGRGGRSFKQGGRGGDPVSFGAYGGFGLMGGGGGQDEDGGGGGGFWGGSSADGPSQGGTCFNYLGDGIGYSSTGNGGGFNNNRDGRVEVVIITAS